MLIARTKAKQAALPRRAVSAPGVKILGRTIKPGSFVRTERVRALHEERRAARSVAESIKQTHTAVGVLQEIQDRVDEVRSKNVDESKVAEKIESRLSAAQASLGDTLSRKSTEEKSVAVLVAARNKANEELAQSNAVLIDIQSTIGQKVNLIIALKERVSELTALLADTRDEKNKEERNRSTLEEEVRDLSSRSEELQKEIDSAKQEHERVLSDIEEAMTGFRVFERRIAKLSNETGYIIGYPKSLKR